MRILKWIFEKIKKYQTRKRLKTKIKELKKRDPFTYPH
jgi:hypothetical protein